jgi:hypothetical protein
VVAAPLTRRCHACSMFGASARCGLCCCGQTKEVGARRLGCDTTVSEGRLAFRQARAARTGEDGMKGAGTGVTSAGGRLTEPGPGPEGDIACLELQSDGGSAKMDCGVCSFRGLTICCCSVVCDLPVQEVLSSSPFVCCLCYLQKHATDTSDHPAAVKQPLGLSNGSHRLAEPATARHVEHPLRRRRGQQDGHPLSCFGLPCFLGKLGRFA